MKYNRKRSAKPNSETFQKSTLSARFSGNPGVRYMSNIIRQNEGNVANEHLKVQQLLLEKSMCQMYEIPCQSVRNFLQSTELTL